MKAVEAVDTGIQVPFLVLYGAVALGLSQALGTGRGPEVGVAVVGAGAAMALGGWLLFGRKVRVDKEGVEVRPALGSRRRLRWDEVTGVRYKTGGVARGARITSKVILETSQGRKVLLHDGLSHWDRFEKLLRSGLAKNGLDLGQARQKAMDDWRSWIAGPHAEDLPALVYWTACTFGGLFLVARVVQG